MYQAERENKERMRENGKKKKKERRRKREQMGEGWVFVDVGESSGVARAARYLIERSGGQTPRLRLPFEK